MEDKNLNNQENNLDNKINEVEKNLESKLEKKKVKKNTSKSRKAERKERRARLLAEKEERKNREIEEKNRKNTRWFYFFILLLLTIIGLFIWDNYKSHKVYKSQIIQLDSLKTSEVFYKSKFIEKDSSLNLLLSNYNNLLRQNLDNSNELLMNKSELLRLQRVIYMQDSILRQVQGAIDVALSGYQSDEISVEMQEGKLYITMKNKLLFPSGSENIQTKGMSALNTLSKVLKNNPNIDIVIEGHTDNIPLNSDDKNYTDNWDLSTARAVAVTRLLINKYNIRPERITAAGRSMFFPIAPNTTVNGRANNRRIEIILTPNLEELYNLAENTVNSQ